MADVAKKLVDARLGTVLWATYYTVPAGKKTIMRNVHVASTGGTSRLFFRVGTGRRMWSDLELLTGASLDWSGFLVLEAGETIQAHESAGSILDCYVSGVEVDA